MNVTISKKGGVMRAAIVDGVLLTAVCVLPALSHVVQLPLRGLSPMTLCLLAGMLLVNDRRNAYVLAVLLPLFSMLVCGMPTPARCVCMMAELLTVVGVFSLGEKRLPTVAAAVGALLCGKVAFYAAKALLLGTVALIGTSLWLQLGTVAVYGILFALLKRG